MKIDCKKLTARQPALLRAGGLLFVSASFRNLCSHPTHYCVAMLHKIELQKDNVEPSKPSLHPAQKGAYYKMQP